MRCAVERALNYVEPPDAPRQSHNILCRAYDISLEANRVYQHNFNHKDLIATGNYDQDAFPVGVCTKLVEQLRSNDIPPSELWTMYVDTVIVLVLFCVIFVRVVWLLCVLV